jgi:hypothetical protein
MPHLAGTGPLRELHFRNELRLDPRRNGRVLRFLSERRLRGLQLDQLAMQLFEDVMASREIGQPARQGGLAAPRR